MRRLLLASLLFVSAQAQAETDASVVLEQLKRMKLAETSLNYDGDLVYLHGPRVETIRITHARDESGEHKRVVSLNSERKQMLMDAGHLFAVLPESGKILVQQQAPELPKVAFGNLAEANEHYEYKLQGKEKVAGHACQVVSIYPRDNYRYGYRFSIEENTGLLLKALTVDRSGQVHEQMMYTRVAFPEQIDSDIFREPLMQDDLVWEEAREANAADTLATADYQPQWQVAALPPGFRQVSSARRTIPGSPGPVEHFVLTDNLATLSLFIARIDEPQRVQLEEGAGKSGGLNVFSRITDGHHITVVGAVPETTVQLIASSVRPVRK